MALDFLARPLLQLELFDGLRPEQIAEIARRAERKIFRAGDCIIERDTPADAAIVIVSGQAQRTAGPDMTSGPELVPEGALLGEMGMLVDTEYTSTVLAVTSVRALRITRDELLQQMAEDPEIAEHFVRKIAQRLQALADEMRAIENQLGDQACGDLARTAALARLPASADAAATLH
ncbi:MAG: cyclic nucleotide-binding domain-containing protein [Hyphomicrobiaceae bacterium]|nr:cyclic nucleotide-binding domain-containing protein [Hyphomicrobiaceae bacterium]